MSHLTLPTHPATGLRAIGLTRAGLPVWPIIGGADDDEDDSDDTGDEDDSSDEDDRFPADTPVAEMTAEQQAAYWRDKSRKHEGRAKSRSDYDAVKAENDRLKKIEREAMDDQQKAIADAKEAGAAEAQKKFAGQLVDAEIKAACVGKIDAEARDLLLDGLDRTKFLDAAGEVDTDKVTAFVDAIAPKKSDTDGKQRKGTDLGQGRRGSSAKPSVSSGRDAYKARRSTNA